MRLKQLPLKIVSDGFDIQGIMLTANLFSNCSNRLIQTINQFGFRRTILIVIKGIIKRVLRISWYPYHIMRGESTNDNYTTIGNHTEEIRKLEMKDFEIDYYKQTIDRKKWKILEDRFKNKNIEGYGIFKDNMLVCYGWINYEKLEITSTTYFPLPPKSALLFDDFCHPAYRKQGFHYLITEYRIKRMIDIGIDTVYVFILKYNVPSIKTMTKLGLKMSQAVTIFKIGKKEYCNLKGVD